MTLLAVGAALGAAAGFAVSTSLQQHAAEAAPETAHGSTRLLAYLCRCPSWLLGMLTGGRPPGKFADRPVLHRRPVLRQSLATAHAGLWAVMALALVGTLAHPVVGLGAHEAHTAAAQLPAAMLGLVAMAAGALALLVTGSSARLTVRETGA